MKRPVLTLTMFSLSAGLLISSALPAQAGLWGSDTTAAEEPASDAGSVEASKWRSKRFKNYDTDKDDSVSKDEFLKNILEDFVRRDENKDGELSADEIDFPPGTPVDQRVDMRKRMQDDEIRDEKMRADMEKRMKESEEKRKLEDEKRKAEEAKKAAEPVKEPESEKKTAEEAAKEAVKEVVKDAAPAATTPKAAAPAVATPTAPAAPVTPTAPVVKKP